MLTLLAWLVLLLGIVHIGYGCIMFRVPLREALRDGFVGRFSAHEARRTAMWFLLCGPLLMLAGHVALHAVNAGDAHLLRVVSAYLLGTSLLGWAAFPKSPFIASTVVSATLAAQSWALP